MRINLLFVAALSCSALWAQQPLLPMGAALPQLPVGASLPQNLITSNPHTLTTSKPSAARGTLRCDSTVIYNELGQRTQFTVFDYDGSGNMICSTNYLVSSDAVTVIWEGLNICHPWDAQSGRFSDYEGSLPYISHETYDLMVGHTICLDIDQIYYGDESILRIMNGWWSETYLDRVTVHAGDVVKFEFTEEMAEACKERDLCILNMGEYDFSISRLYYESENESVGDVYPSLRNEYAYDAYGNCTLEALYVWDWETNDWEGFGHKKESVYDGPDLISVEAEYQWIDGVWMPYMKSEYTRDEEGRLLTQMDYEGKGDDWELLSKTEFEYDLQNQFSTALNYVWLFGEWTLTGKRENSYDEHGNLLRTEQFNKVEEDWSLFLTYTYEYDDLGQLICFTYDWGFIVYKIDYTYDENGNLLSQVMYYDEDGEWIPNSKEEDTYDANSNKTSSAHYQYKAGKWQGEGSKMEYTYDAAGNNVGTIQYYWEGSELVPFLKSESVYDDDNNCLTTNSYVWDFDDWRYSSQTVYYYSETHDGIEQLTDESLHAAPSFDLLGQRIAASQRGQFFVRDGKILVVTCR